MSSIDWPHLVGRDLAPFADPAATGSRIFWAGNKATWEYFGKKHTAEFSIDNKGLIAVNVGKRLWSYSGFLASEHIADLTGLAKRSLQWHGEHPYVDTKAQFSDGTEQPATDLLNKLLHEQKNDATQVVFVTADAGAGKTRTLQHLARKQARSYLTGTTDWLYLYVDAQGRALASLDEAFAVELDNLRTRLTYGMIAPLVRSGLLVPIIDGFDELLGSTYADGFASLSRFLEDLDGTGRVVACARNTYYEQEFANRATTSSQLGSQTWQVLTARLLDWGEKEREAFVRLKCKEEGFSPGHCKRMKQKLIRVIDAAPTYLVQRPFFFSHLTDLVFGGWRVKDTPYLVTAVVEAYLKRECEEKLLEKVTRHPFLEPKQLEALLTDIAEEMWREETRELEVAEVRDLVHLAVAIDELDAQVKERIEQKSPMLAFLTPAAGRSRRVAFEHELFFSYFLGNALARAISFGADRLSYLLKRARVPTQAADVAVRNQETTVSDVMKLCGGHTHSEHRAETIRENCGALIGASLRALGEPRIVVGLTFSRIAFRSQALAQVTFRKCAFTAVEFNGVDLTTTRFEDCTARDLHLVGCQIDPERTRLHIAGVGLEAGIGLIIASHPEQTLYDPNEVRKALRDCGLPAAMQLGPTYDVRDEIVDLVSRLATVYEHTSVVWPEDDRMSWLRTSRAWDGVRRSLIESEVVVQATATAQGPARPRWRRRFSPADIIAGYYRHAAVPQEVRTFWQALEDAFPS